jgi:hypothetical protein
MNLASGGRSSPFSWHNATKFAQLRHRSGLQGRVVRAPSPPSMLAPLHGSGVARVVAAGLHRYIRRRKAQLRWVAWSHCLQGRGCWLHARHAGLAECTASVVVGARSMLGIGAATLAVMLPQCGWTFAQDAADQVHNVPARQLCTLVLPPFLSTLPVSCPPTACSWRSARQKSHWRHGLPRCWLPTRCEWRPALPSALAPQGAWQQSRVQG